MIFALAGNARSVLALGRLSALEHAVRDRPFARAPAPFRGRIGLGKILIHDHFAGFDGQREVGGVESGENRGQRGNECAEECHR